MRFSFNAACGCTPTQQVGACDWHVIGKASRSKSRTILQAGELKLSSFKIEDISAYPEHFERYIDYLEAPREERLRLRAELEEFFASTAK